MPKFSERSLKRLATCEDDLRILMLEAVKHIDITIIYGHRTPEEQFELFKKGRRISRGEWLIEDRSKIVTYKDGFKNRSKHNRYPSYAVDIAPYPIDWKDYQRFTMLGAFIMGLAEKMYQYGEIKNRIVWGADWDSDWNIKEHSLIDYPHFQI